MLTKPAHNLRSSKYDSRDKVQRTNHYTTAPSPCYVTHLQLHVSERPLRKNGLLIKPSSGGFDKGGWLNTSDRGQLSKRYVSHMDSVSSEQPEYSASWYPMGLVHL